jgi:hypothetical protein
MIKTYEDFRTHYDCLKEDGQILFTDDYAKIKTAIEIVGKRLERTTITGSFISNELYVLKKDLFRTSNKNEDGTDIQLLCPSKGFYSNGNRKFFVGDLTPNFEGEGSRKKYLSSKVGIITQMTYDDFLKYVPMSLEEITKIGEQHHDYQVQQGIYYEITFKEGIQRLYLQVGEDAIGFELNNHKKQTDIRINGYDIELDCRLADFESAYTEKLKQEKIEFATNNKIEKISNGYIFNNTYYENVLDIPVD